MVKDTVLVTSETLLYLIDSFRHFDAVASIIRPHIKRGSIIYITTNKPFPTLTAALGRERVPSERVFFIDCVSVQALGEKPPDATNCAYIESQESLTELSIAISEVMERIMGEKILIFDSIGTLLLYNDAAAVGRFVNFLVNKLRLSGVDGYLFGLASEKEELKSIMNIVDEVKVYGA